VEGLELSKREVSPFEPKLQDRINVVQAWFNRI